MKCNRNLVWLVVLLTLALAQAGAQILTGDEVKKVVPGSFFFAGQSAAVQVRNSVGLKNSAGKLVLAGMVDTAGYSSGIAEKYQGFLIAETKLSFDGATLDAGAYGFGFKEDKFIVMNVAGTEVFSIACQSNDKMERPVPQKLEKDGARYRLYAGRKYVVVTAD